MSEESSGNGKLPRGQSSLRSRLLRALSEGWAAPVGQRHPTYRLRDGKAIRKGSAARLAEQLTVWEQAHPTNGYSGRWPNLKPDLKSMPTPVMPVPTSDPEITAISVMLTLDPEARKRVLAYVESRS